MDRYFQISERGSSFATEFRAGTVTFLTMCYILLVNPQILSQAGLLGSDVVVATAAASAFGSAVCGIGANMPFGLAPGLGLSAYFAYGMVQVTGMSWEEALTACAVSGALSALLAMLRVGDMIMRIIPECIKMATVVGMGLMLCFIGLMNIDLVVKDDVSIVKMGDVTSIAVILAFVGLAIIATLQHHEFKGGILIGIISVTLLFWGLHSSWPTEFVSLPRVQNALFKIRFDLISTRIIPAVLAFLAIQIFDVSGCMYGVAKLANLISEDGDIEGGAWTLGTASIASILAACLGCTPIIVHLECAAGVKEGGRTGLSAIVTSLWFIVSLFFAPLFGAVPAAATSPVVIFVGACMIELATKIDWQRMDQAIPAFMTIVIMSFTLSIADGILFGMLFSMILFITTGNFLDYLPLRFRSRGVVVDADDFDQALLSSPKFQGSPISERTPSLILNKSTIDKLSPQPSKGSRFFRHDQQNPRTEQEDQLENSTLLSPGNNP